MPKFLKGNYKLLGKKGQLRAPTRRKDLTEKFEESALANLGGSLCFVVKKQVLMWEGDEVEGSGQQPG